MHRRNVLKALAAAGLAPWAAASSYAAGEDIGIDAATKTITIGAFTPVTGPVPFYAILTHAADAFFRHANESGGVRGWRIKYVTLDDGYDPARSVAVARTPSPCNSIVLRGSRDATSAGRAQCSVSCIPSASNAAPPSDRSTLCGCLA